MKQVDFGSGKIAQNIFQTTIPLLVAQLLNLLFFSLFRKVILVIPLTFLLPHLWNLRTNGVFMAEPVSNFIGGSACYITMLLTILPELTRKRNLSQPAIRP